jgi:hypothetical protein
MLTSNNGTPKEKSTDMRQRTRNFILRRSESTEVHPSSKWVKKFRSLRDDWQHDLAAKRQDKMAADKHDKDNQHAFSFRTSTQGMRLTPSKKLREDNHDTGDRF